jgi:hypothetical protein
MLQAHKSDWDLQGWATEVRTATHKYLITDSKEKSEAQEQRHCQWGAFQKPAQHQQWQKMKDIVRVE